MSESNTRTKSMTKDMTKDMTSGNPFKLLLSFAIPLFFGNICQQLYNIADTVVVGRGVGVDALAAVGSTGALNWMVIGFITGLTHGFSILISQSFGSHDMKKTRKVIVMSIYLSMIISVIISILCGVFSKQMLMLLNTPEEILHDATVYISIIFGGSVSIILYNVTAGILRSVGNSKTPLIVIIICSVINIILDIIFVVLFKWGVVGAAVATLIASLISGIICLVAVIKIKELKPHKEDLYWDNKLAKDLILIGLPVGFMNSVTAVGNVMLQKGVNALGAVLVAAYTLGCKIVGMADQLLNVIGMSLGIYVGQNIGAKNIKRTREGVKAGTVLEIIFSLIITLIMVFAGKNIASLFISGGNENVINGSYPYLLVCGVMMWSLGMLFTFRFSLQGMGDTIIPMYSGFLELALRLGFVFLLPSSLGFWRICIAEVSAWLGAAIMLGIGYFVRIRNNNISE